jgi:hypothetical protein
MNVDFSALKKVFFGSNVEKRLQTALEKADRQVANDVSAAYNTLFDAVQEELTLIRKIKDTPGLGDWLYGQKVDLNLAKGRKK